MAVAAIEIAADGLAWGVDVGGTDCKVGVVDGRGQVRVEQQFPTARDPRVAAQTIGRACRELAGMAGAEVTHLGIGVPGPLDLEQGVIIQAPNLGWRDVPMRDMVAAEVGCPAVLDNDANAAAFGEAWVGAGREARVLLLVTLGTGVGGGVVEAGRVFHGARGLAVEIGHQIVVPGGRRCSCGKRGCVEAYFSGHALTEQAAEGLRDEDPTEHRQLFAAYGDGDPAVRPWMDTAIDALALGVAHAGILFDPDQIVFTGGLTRSWQTFGASLMERVREGLGPAGPAPDGMGLSELDGRAGVIGAAGLALTRRLPA